MAQQVKQHTVSKTYLKHFSLNGDGKDIYVLNRADKHRPYVQKLNSGDSVFWERNFYNSNKFATPTELESFFANEIEPTYNGIIERVKSNVPITELNIKLELFQWIIYSKMRSPIWRTYYLEILEKAPDFQGVEMDFSREKLVKELHLTFFTDEEKLNELVEKFSDALFNKKWKIHIAPMGHYWWTTDNPGFGINLDVFEKNGEVLPDPFWNNLSHNALFYFPLSKDYCLQIGPYDKGESVHLNLTNTDITFERMNEEAIGLINFWSLITQNNLLISNDKRQLERVAALNNKSN